MQTTHIPPAFARKSKWFVGAALAPLLFVGGCASNTGTGALVGAGAGRGRRQL